VIGIVFQRIEPHGGPVGRGGLLIIVAAGLIYTVLGIPVAFVRDWLPMLLSPDSSRPVFRLISPGEEHILKTDGTGRNPSA
jgi:hypothetical protein